MIGRSEDQLYVIRCQSTGAIKVGRSLDPTARLAQLQTGCPTELHLWWRVPGGAFLERFFHEVFGDERIRGEWYPKGSRAELCVGEWLVLARAPYFDAATLIESFGFAVDRAADLHPGSGRWHLADGMHGEGGTSAQIKRAWNYAQERQMEWGLRSLAMETLHEALFDRTIHGKPIAPTPPSKLPAPAEEAGNV
jgi:hypothetical protein